MDIDKLVNEALYEFHSDMSTQVQSAVDRELDAVREYNNEFGEEETSLSESLLMTALPAALSAGIGALNMRRTLAKSSNLNEVDWEEMAGKAGKVAGKVGDWMKNKTEDMSLAKGAERIGSDSGKLLKAAKNKFEDLVDSDKAKTAGKMLKSAGRNIEDKVENIKGGSKGVLKQIGRSVQDKIEGTGGVKGAARSIGRDIEDKFDNAKGSVSSILKNVKRKAEDMGEKAGDSGVVKSAKAGFKAGSRA